MDDRPSVILIVDDHSENRKLLASIITKHTGHQIMTAANGKAVLEHIGEQMPDLILLDIMMPEMDGYQLAEILKKNDKTRNIPIIFITALDSEEDKVKAFDHGGIDYIVKPFNHNEVLSRVNAHLQAKRHIEHITEYNETIRYELSIARQIQKNFISLRSLREGILSVHTRYHPKDEISGDTYDVISVGGGRYLFFIADVTGHGIPAALYTMMLKSSLEKQIRDPAVRLSPAGLLDELNKELCETLIPGFFITAFLMLADLNEMTCVYANAAHPSPLFYRAALSELVQLPVRTTILGVKKTLVFEEETLPLALSDKILFYTDGLTEAPGDSGRVLGESKLRDVFLRNKGLSGDELLDKVINEMKEASRDKEWDDDVTLMVMELIPPSTE